MRCYCKWLLHPGRAECLDGTHDGVGAGRVQRCHHVIDLELSQSGTAVQRREQTDDLHTPEKYERTVTATVMAKGHGERSWPWRVVMVMANGRGVQQHGMVMANGRGVQQHGMGMAFNSARPWPQMRMNKDHDVVVMAMPW